MSALSPLTERIRRKLLGWIAPAPLACRHSEHSIICSMDDDPSRPSRRLATLFAAVAAECAQAGEMPLRNRGLPLPAYYETWPGEHYRLLAALAKVLQPIRILEVGTYQGVSALTLLDASAAGGAEVVTNDIVPWDRIPGQLITARDFSHGRLRQIVGDLSRGDFFRTQRPLVESCDLIFIDGPKDGRFEPEFWRLLEQAKLKEGVLVMFDDVRLWNMLAFWRGIQRPKMDWTSIGHWSGSGVVDWHGTWEH